MKPNIDNDPFSLSSLFQTVKNDKLNQLLWAPVEWILGFKKLSTLYQTHKDKKPPQVFIKDILKELEINYVVNSDVEIPKTGSLLIVSNHPFGALEALIIADYLSEYRSDIRIMANVFLKRISPISDLLFGVNPFKDKVAIKNNQKVMREIHQWLQNENCLITFPAGNVSHLHLKKPYIADGEWDQQIARLARSTKANVLPIYIEGKNSFWFYTLGPHLHALGYAWQFLNKKGKMIKIRIGEIISQNEINSFQSDMNLIEFIRLKTIPDVDDDL